MSDSTRGKRSEAASAGTSLKRVIIAGGTGFVGGALVERLKRRGYQCVVLSRSTNPLRHEQAGGVVYQAYSAPWPERIDAVINLAGESIVGRWTVSKKRRVMQSRVETTRLLVKRIAQMSRTDRPGVLLSASAVGYYGNRPGEVLTESSALDPHLSFRAAVCREWELAAKGVERQGVRLVTLRLGNVMHPSGGYLAGILRLQRWGVCLALGNAAALVPWVSLDDAVRMMEFALVKDEVRGPMNITAPKAVTQRRLTEIAAETMGRGARGTMPAWMIRLVAGEFAQAVLDTQDVRPEVGLRAGYRFLFPDLREYVLKAMAAGQRAQ